MVKKTDYNTKVTDIENKLNNHNHDKYIATPEFNNLAANVFNVRLSQANLTTKTIIVYQILIIKLLRIQQKMILLKMN